MKTEKAFLNGMWYMVEVLEREELEKQRVKALNRKLTVKKVGLIVSGIIILTAALLFNQFIVHLIYPLTIGIMIVAFFIEYLSITRLEERDNGN